MTAGTRRALYLAGAVSLLLLSAWSLLWVFSSYSMAFAACKGSFSFFAEQLRCRQPPIAAALSALSLTLAVVLIVVRARIHL